MKKFEEFNRAHATAMQDIQLLLDKGNELSTLLKWMLTTDANPYSYLPDGWANALSSSTGFANLAFLISHALYDDGEITFAEDTHNQPCIFLLEPEHLPPGCVVLDIGPEEFVKRHEQFQLEQLKKNFVTDAAMQSFEFAVEHYSKYSMFDIAWAVELADEITKREEMYKFRRSGDSG